ncbi:MAG: DUF6457 domain-containing protein [Pseudonocardiaceae bacterium]
MNTLQEWIGVVCRELDIVDVVQPAALQSRVLDMARDVAHDVARPAAPLTAYLVGLAAGLSGDPEATADELAQRVCLLAQRWAADQGGAGGQADQGGQPAPDGPG